MDNLMLQIKNGSRMIADLSQTEIEKLKSYASKKIAYYDRELRKQHPNTSGNEPFLEDDDGEMKTYEGESSESDGKRSRQQASTQEKSMHVALINRNHAAILCQSYPIRSITHSALIH
ncbi:hypothetical protein YC2023_120652 [Brassica napus]